MKRFGEYASFEKRLINELKKNPDTLLNICYRMKEEVTPVNSMLHHLRVCELVDLKTDDKWYFIGKRK